MRTDPLFRQLPVVAEGRLVAPPMAQALGLRFPSPLSIPYLLAQLEGPLAAALDWFPTPRRS